MKTFVSSTLAAKIANPAATLAWCWILKRLDGQWFGFTTSVRDLFVVTLLTPDDPPPGIVGYAVGTVKCLAAPGFNPSDIATTGTLSQNNLDIEAMLLAAGITEDDIRAKLWQAARLEICLVDYTDTSVGTGTDTLFMGTLGGFVGGDVSVKAEQRGLTQPLEDNLEDVTGPMCRVKLGSMGPGLCNKDITSFLRTGTVAGWVADRLFVDAARTEADDWWTKGLLTFTSGDAIGQTFEVKHSLADGTIELVEEVYYGFANGDTYLISPGCNKLAKVGASDGTFSYIGDCIVKYDNMVNNQSECEVLGQSAIQQYGGQTVANPS